VTFLLRRCRGSTRMVVTASPCCRIRRCRRGGGRGRGGAAA